MEEHTLEADVRTKEELEMRGVVTLALYDREGNEVVQQRRNLITDSLKNRVLGPLAGVPQDPRQSTLVTRFVFGGSNVTPLPTNTRLGHELFRKPLTSSTISGSHFIADCNIAFSELNTLVATVTNIASPTSITLSDTLNLQQGDMLEINDVNTVGNTTRAQFVEIASISGFNVTLVAPGLNMTTTPAPANGWFAMLLVREAGVLMSVSSSIVQSPTSFNSFAVSDPSVFRVGDTVNVPVNPTIYETGTVSSINNNTITLSSNLTAPPLPGMIVENGVLANHATGFTFRKTSALTAIARVDFSMA